MKFKEFFLSNFRYIRKFWANQIALSCFGTMIGFAAVTLASKNNMSNGICLAAGIFSAGFFLFLVYDVFWEFGASDKIKIRGNRLKESSMRGALATLCALIPTFVILIVFYICYFLSMSDIQIAADIAGVLSMLYQLLIQGMFSGIFMYFENLQPWIFPASIVVTLVCTHVAYCLGLAEIHLFKFSTEDQRK